jgi:signal peptidase I
MKSIQSWYNSILVYSIFSCVYIFLTVLATAFFLSFFEIKRTDEAVPPLFRKGDIIAIKKISLSGYRRGDIVVAKTDSGVKLLRVIGIPGERIEYRKGRFLSEGSELPLSIFNDDELRKIYLTDYDVISEQNGRTRYAVKSNPAINIPETTLADKEFYLAPDVRNTPELFLKIQNSGIRGRVEGIILSREEGILPGSISLPSDNFISANK